MNDSLLWDMEQPWLLAVRICSVPLILFNLNFKAMTRESKIGKVIRLLRSNQVETDLCSPNYVADFAHRRGIELTSEEVVHISNIYHLEPQENK